MEINHEQRWEGRQARWVAPDRHLFNPADHRVARITEKDAKAFVIKHHYSGSFPSQRLCTGLFEGSRLVGVCVFSVPAQQAVIPKWTGQEPAKGAELGRFVLLDGVGYNAESWFGRKSFRVLTEETQVESVVSYSDPVERTALTGSVIKPGHIGTIYKGLNALFKGRSRARTLLLRPDGTTISERALFKLRPRADGARDKGFTRAWQDISRFLPHGTEPPTCREEGWDRFRREVFASPQLRRLRNPGNLVYVWHLRGPRKRADRESLPYLGKDAIISAAGGLLNV